MSPVSICSNRSYRASFPVDGGNFDDAGLISGEIKSLLKEMGLISDVVRRTALVSYESEINMVSYARRGKIILQVLPRHVILEAVDEGPGIDDIRLAIQKGWSTASEKIREMGFGAGMGLNNIRTYSDIFHISSEVGVGTRLKMIIHIPREGERQDGGTGL
jgi:serine/threonine-protein kinase RsbT